MNNKFRNLFLVAFTLVLSSCMGEVADPADNADVLGGSVASVAEQVDAIKASLADVEAVKEELNNVSGLQNVQAFEAQLDACVSGIESHIASVNGGMPAQNATLAAMQLQAEIAEVVGAIKAYAGELSEIATLEKGVKSWIGNKFENYYLATSECAKVKAMSAIFEAQALNVDALISDVEAGLRAEDTTGSLAEVEATVAKSSSELSGIIVKLESLCSELESGYESAIKSSSSDSKKALKSLNTKAGELLDSTLPTLNQLLVRMEECEEAIADIEERLGEVETTVAELLNMIQSVTFVSSSSSNYAYAYYNMDVNTKVSDSNLPYYGKAQRTATGNIELTYMVRPAAAADALNANLEAVSVFGYYAESITTRAVSPTDLIKFNVTKVEKLNSGNGLVTVTVVPELKEAFYYKEIGAKCALSIKSGKTDVTSSFVEVLPKDNSTTVYATGVTPSRTSIELDKGESLELSAVVSPSNAVQVCYWTSSNNGIASFNGSTMTANEVGNTTVKVTTSAVDEWGLQLTAEIPVKVNEAVRLTGQRYVEVGYTADMFLEYPKTAIIESKVWSTSDPSKLTVDQNGKVTGVAHTYNTITKAYSEVSVSCTINGVTTVSWPMYVAATQPKKLITSNLADNQSEISLRVNESLSLASTIYPENVPDGAYKIIYQSDQGLGWINYDTGVIDANRNTYATTAWVTITVENYDKEQYYITDSRVKRVIAVKVLPYYVKTISLDDVDLELGQSATLSPRFTSDVTGKQPTNTAVTWTSSNSSVVTVDQSGKVTSVAGGTATITATATDGSNVSGSCTVTVTERWKEFNIGDYVAITSSGDIEFSADLNTAKSKGRVVGVVIIQTNPRVTDIELPSNCTHGIAISLEETADVKWQEEASNVGQWLEQNRGYSYLKDTGRICGYSNTLGLQAYNAVCASNNKVLPADCAPNVALGSKTSGWYLPSYAELKMLFDYESGTRTQMISNGAIANKIVAAGGTPFSIVRYNYDNPDGSQDAPSYWASTESSTSSSWATCVHLLHGGQTNRSKTSKSYYIARYVFAF